MPKNVQSPVLTEHALELIAARFKLLGEPSRLKLLNALKNGEKNVSELVAATGLSQANASRHLQALADAGILSRRKDGLSVIYKIAEPGIFSLCENVCGSLQQHYTANAKAFEV
jgi:ArsR family transcriptional regulator